MCILASSASIYVPTFMHGTLILTYDVSSYVYLYSMPYATINYACNAFLYAIITSS